MTQAKMENQTNQPGWSENGDLRILEYRMELSRTGMLDACRLAVECLERFAAQARREFERWSELNPTQLADLPGKVLAASVWGAANAASELSRAAQEGAAYMHALGNLEARRAEALRARAAS